MTIGTILAVIASVFFGISLAIQKYSVSSLKKFSLKGMAKNKMWMLAIAVGIVGILIYLVALNLADLTTVQPITALSVIIPIAVGATMFKEKLEAKKWALLLIVLIGMVLVSLF